MSRTTSEVDLTVLRRNLEAVLMVVDQPVSAYELARAFGTDVETVTRVLRSGLAA